MSSSGESQKIQVAASWLRERIGPNRLDGLQLAMVLGSGLKDFADNLEDAIEVPFAEVPEWPAPEVEGHGG